MARTAASVPDHPRAGAAGLFLGGLGLAAGQAPLGLWWLALPALAAGIAAVAAVPEPRRAAWRAWVGGAGYFAGALFWIVEPFLVDPVRHAWMAPFALVFTACGFALFWALAAWAAAHLSARARGRALALAITLAVAELLRGYVFTGFPWALIGHLWIGTPQMQFAALAGPVGLTLLATLAAALPTGLPVGPWRVGGVVAALVLVATAGVFGVARTAGAPAVRGEPLRVRLVQPDAAQHLKWRPDMVPVFFDRQLRLTAKRSEPPADVVIWPETALAYDVSPGSEALAQISEAAGGRRVIFGALRRVEGRPRNSLIALAPDGTIAAVYDKHHLVPFGEYLPLGRVLGRLGLTGLAASEGYGAGPGPRVLELGPLGEVLPLICYEAIFPQDLTAAPRRADWILQITNDAWFGRLAGPYQHLAQARLRAVEMGLPVLRAANTGVSAAIDPYGRVTERLSLGTSGALNGAVPAALPTTPYARTGDWPVALALAAALAAMTARRLLIFRRRPVRPPA